MRNTWVYPGNKVIRKRCRIFKWVKNKGYQDGEGQQIGSNADDTDA
ncbi:MAG TPA: hypothetical protein VFC67_16825 [Prolixibacteraceae bacterium]|nr:hypothetical protein [Prolixibacteraceae bacterium]